MGLAVRLIIRAFQKDEIKKEGIFECDPVGLKREHKLVNIDTSFD